MNQVYRAAKGLINEDERLLIQNIRKEAYEAKDCFTRFSFQTLAISAAALVLILRFQEAYEPAAYASIVITVFILAVVRIGLHKLETVNRLLGYELHIYRRARLKDSAGEGFDKWLGWKRHMREIGWEEALYAWRVIQPVLYDHLYKKYPWIRPTKKTIYYKKAFADPQERWFAPADRNVGDADGKKPLFYAGRYFQGISFFYAYSCGILHIPLDHVDNRVYS